MKAVLPKNYEYYVFDLYGTLVDIRTDEGAPELWRKLALFYGYYDARYEAEELKEAYHSLVAEEEDKLKVQLEMDRRKRGECLEDAPRYAHESSPEIEITGIFKRLFEKKGVEVDETLAMHAGQFFRVLSTEYVKTYPGTAEMLAELKALGKKVYLLSNAQRIFTEYEMHVLDIAQYFDGILISSDHKTRKPDPRFFELLMERYAVDPQKTLFIGNDATNDIDGARNVGMDTYYVFSNISPKNDDTEVATYAEKAFSCW